MVGHLQTKWQAREAVQAESFVQLPRTATAGIESHAEWLEKI
jgi:hypothetical protein